jgi:hypothetical protein
MTAMSTGPRVLSTGVGGRHGAVKKNEKPVLTGPRGTHYISAINDGVAATKQRR